MITVRGQILVSRTDDDPLPPVCGFQTSPCVRSKRPRVYRHHAYMFQHMCAWRRHTWGRLECTHGDVFEPTHGFFHIFSACRNTHKHTHTHTHTHEHTHTTKHTTTTKQHHDHNDTHHTTQHTTSHGDREKERDRESDRERETRQDKRR